jgi:hypothetical protein
MSEKTSTFQLDAVIPWVNGNDKKWQEQLNNYLTVKIDFTKKKESVRFNSIGEIDIAIKSIIKYAPFFKNIYLITDDQQPEAFESLKALGKSSGINLELIDHKVLFKGYEEFLPCFNSCSIESLLFNIPKLSEHFVLFNDDFFIMRDANVSDFFTNGKPIIRGNWKTFNEDRMYRKMYHKLLASMGKYVPKKGISYKELQQNGAKLAGTDKYIRRFHSPYPIRKSTIAAFFKNYDVKNNIQYRFRDKNQFIICSLSDHLEIKNNTYDFQKNTKLSYFRSYKNHLVVMLKLFWFDINKNKVFITFQSLEMADNKTQSYILNWLHKKL